MFIFYIICYVIDLDFYYYYDEVQLEENSLYNLCVYVNNSELWVDVICEMLLCTWNVIMKHEFYL